MKAIETYAVFDENGKMIMENQPALKNKNVKVLILIDEQEREQDFYSLSAQGLSKAYSIYEPDYSMSLIKEANTFYGGR